MTRRLSHSASAAALIALAAGTLAASEPAGSHVVMPVLQRFLSTHSPSPIRYRALRHMEAKAEHFASDAWMDVWTEIDAAGTMQYRIVGEGGSDYIRSKVFRGVLEAERKAINSGAPAHAGITPENYAFEDRGAAPDGLAQLGIKPRRKDVLLVDGSIYVRPGDGELTRLEGRLSKTPSFWVRRVEIVRDYKRFGGISMPVALESVANLLIAGRSTFKMSYDYESVDGRQVGAPQTKTIASLAP